MTPLKSTCRNGVGAPHWCRKDWLPQLSLKSVGVLNREYGVGIKHRSGKIGGCEGDPTEIDPLKSTGPLNWAVEHRIGAGKINLR